MLRSLLPTFFFLIFIYLWLCWVFVSVRGLSLVVASGGHSSSQCAGLPLTRTLLLRSTGSRRAGSVIVAHGPSCSAAYGILPDQGSNPCPLHWQADSQPLRHQGSPSLLISTKIFTRILIGIYWVCRLICITFGKLYFSKNLPISCRVSNVLFMIFSCYPLNVWRICSDNLSFLIW